METNIVKRSFGFIYQKLFLINDTPQKIALGIGLGVFAGILPGTGPLAALFLALAFRANRAAALLGSAFTNTWLSLVSFLLAVKIGSTILKVKWEDVQAGWSALIKEFSWKALSKLSLLETLLPVILGYFIIALACGLIAYIIALLIALQIKRNSRK
jgi:uncharacterized protein (DUF2062 family)